MAQTQKKQQDMGTGDVKKLLLQLMIPAVVAQVVNLLYNIVDRIYIGHIPETGSMALTGVGVCLPIIMVISAFAALMAFGGAPRASIAEGRGDLKESERIMGNSFTMLVAVSVVLTVVFLVFAEPMLRIFGASDNTIGYALNYMRIYALGTIFVQVTLGMNAYITAQGFTVVGMKTVLIGAILNTVLDPIFILPWGFDMGAGGAGLATFLSNCVACLYFFVLLFIKRGNTFVCIDPKKLSFQKDIVSGVCAVGIPASIQNLLNVTGMTILNNFSSSYGASAVAAIGICQKIYMVPMYISQGISQGVMPLISYTFSSNNIPRMKHAVSFARKAALTIIISVALLFFLFPGFWVELFMKDATIVEYGSHLLRRFCMGLPFLSIDFLAVGVFQAVGMGRESLLFAILRKVVLEIPALFILNALFGLYGLASAQFCAEVILATAAILVLRKLFKRLEESVPAPQEG